MFKWLKFRLTNLFANCEPLNCISDVCFQTDLPTLVQTITFSLKWIADLVVVHITVSLTICHLPKVLLHYTWRCAWNPALKWINVFEYKLKYTRFVRQTNGISKVCCNISVSLHAAHSLRVNYRINSRLVEYYAIVKMPFSHVWLKLLNRFINVDHSHWNSFVSNNWNVLKIIVPFLVGVSVQSGFSSEWKGIHSKPCQTKTLTVGLLRSDWICIFYSEIHCQCIR